MDKAILRRELAEAESIPTEVSALASDKLFRWLSGLLPGTITIFCAFADEVDLIDLVDRLPGWQWLLPRIEADRTLTWRDARLPLETHRWGMSQPIESGPITETFQVDIFLVPGLAFDRTGNRLGRGRGFYDRELLARRSDSKAVGVTVERRVVDAVPAEPHDQKVDYLATESGVRETPPTK